MAAIPHYNNQLLFNLDVPAMPTNMSVKFHRPEPIVIEKFGGNNTNTSYTVPQAHTQALQLSNVSEERLSIAVQLAKRDLKKQRQDESLRASQTKENKQKGRTRIEHSRGYLDHVKRRQARVKGPGKVVERSKGADQRSKAAQTRTRPADSSSNVVFVRHKPMPAMSNSPPTRDADTAGDVTGDKVQREITRLRQEMVDCMNTIQQMEVNARKTVVQPPKKQYAEDIEAERKRVTRSDEQATRSARTIYQLMQQVRGIQEEIDKLGPAPIKHTKKSQAMSKLAAVHRGAVRAIQTFIQHIPDCDLKKGLPRAYHDLTMLLRQLSLCCAQLEVAGETGIPDSVLCLLNDYKTQIQSTEGTSPPRNGQQTTQIKAKVNKSPASRKLEFDDHPPKKPVVVKETVTQPPRGVDKAVDATPDRQSALRAGIQALVRAADSPRSPQRQTHRSPVPPLNLPATPRTPRGRRGAGGVAWEVPAEPKGRGLLLPAKLQAKRQNIQRPAAPRPRAGSPDLGYAEPTFSSRLKEVHFPNDAGPAPSSPRSALTPRSPSTSPRRGRSSSPYSSPVGSARQAVTQQVLADRQSVAHGSARSYNSRLDTAVAEAEERIRQKLKPLLADAQNICEQYERMIRHDTHSLRHRLSEKAIEQVEMNADALADMLLQDVVTDTAGQLHQLKEDGEISDEANAMMDAPSLETMIQRMHDMELEQEQIRRRWATIVYEDDVTGAQRKAAYLDMGDSNQPTTPPPLEVTSIRSQDQPTQDLRMSQLSRTSPILFTKPSIKTTQREALGFAQPPAQDDSNTRTKDPVFKKIPLFLTNQIVNNIQRHKMDFESHLKKACHQTVGRFNPWQIVEEVADEIMEQCVHDVASELETINHDIVNHVYESEFMPQEHSNEPQSFDNQAPPPTVAPPVVREVVFGTDSNYPIVGTSANDPGVVRTSTPHDEVAEEPSERVITKTEPTPTYTADTYSQDYETEDSLDNS